jgi:hypothetical protein
VTALLFLGYLRVSWTVAATSDGAAQALQARDMLAGNWLLHGWRLSDVSFYTTELPEYVLVELIRPFGAGVVHVAAAVTYTLLVALACALARGRARGAEGLARGLLAAGIMLAPQLGYGAFVLLLSPDHVGTQVPLLAGWLLLDRAQSPPGGPTPRTPRGRRWRVPAALCLLRAWVQFADRVALVTAVLPLILVCTVTLVRKVTARRPTTRPASRRDSARARARADGEEGGSYEVTLAIGAVGSVGVAWAGARVLDAAGGFAAHPLPFTLAPLRLLWTHAWLTGWGVLEVYGANFLGVTGWAGRTFAVVHLAGLALAAAALAVALGRLLRPRGAAGRRRRVPRRVRRRRVPRRQVPRRPADLVDSVLAVAIVANLVSYVLSIEPGTVVGTGYDAREIAAVLPLGAVLAGRVFGPGLLSRFPSRYECAVTAAIATPMAHSRRRRTGREKAEDRTRSGSRGLAVLAFALVLAAYGVAFGYSAARPPAAGPEAVLADWLAGHGLRYGLGGASANIVTADSGGRAEVATVTVSKGRVRPLLYQSSVAAYDPGLHRATFVVTGVPAARSGASAEAIPAAAVRATFGPPARVYRFDGFTVGVWDVNLLTKMRE